MKKSFAMLVAIAFIVILGTISGLMLTFSAMNLQKTSDNYLTLQGELYSKSATEFAIQALEARDFKEDGCIDKIDINTSLYDLNMTFHYFLTDCSNCTNCSTIKTRESNGTVMINTYVNAVSDNNETVPIRIFRQTLQKI